ncbi:serine/threonine-protein kinase [Kitasatospora sp. NPDC059973]|uniref:serine/threonine-protein kinase n=1 Tax=Kitasatospora sp. NPDC059973 TaxID=3347020 RepID=UPI0036C26A04
MGTRIADRYRLEVLLGRGGMGEVWRAHDPRLDRGVAIKFLAPQPAAGAVAAQRFHREAQVTARFQHPGITQIFDSGEQGGRLYLVMELLRGRDLGEVLHGRPSGLPVDEAVELTAQLAGALSYAHRLGIVHRDIKPANLVLLPDGTLKVCDFGLAGYVRADSGLTREGSVMGTPEYMAPEQWRSPRVDGRADLYALGCVLFALLTGRPPFPARGGLWTLMVQHLQTPAPRLAPLRPEVPDELDELVAELLAKDPADRPADAGAVVARLRAVGRRPSAPEPRTPAVPATVPTAVPTAVPAVVHSAGLGLELHRNEFLAPGATEAHTILTVTGPSGAADRAAAGAPRALVLLVGLSPELPEADFRAVGAAVAAVIDGLDEDASFAVVAGSAYARMLYPDTQRLVRATAAAKAGARAALAGLEPVGAAAFGRWIRLADRLFAGHADAARTAILLTDLEAAAESADDLAAALASCAGRFPCHARGIGERWSVAQVRSVTSALGGTLDIVPAPASPTGRPGLHRELASLVDRTRRAGLRDLALRITTYDDGGVRYLKQVSPQFEDLSERGQPVGPGVTEYPVDIADDESLDFHLCVGLRPGREGEEVVAAELEIVQLPPTGDGRTLVRARMPVHRVGDPARPAAEPVAVDREALLRAIGEGLRADGRSRPAEG